MLIKCCFLPTGRDIVGRELAQAGITRAGIVTGGKTLGGISRPGKPRPGKRPPGNHLLPLETLDLHIKFKALENISWLSFALMRTCVVIIHNYVTQG